MMASSFRYAFSSGITPQYTTLDYHWSQYNPTQTSTLPLHTTTHAPAAPPAAGAPHYDNPDNTCPALR